jgi:SAM-dependent methyltransferase
MRTVQFCRLCQASVDAAHYDASEKMFRLGGSFTYFQCPQCDCLQAAKTDVDLSNYYPSNYYSFSAPQESSSVRRWLMRERDRAALGWRSLVGQLMLKLRPNAPMAALACLKLTTGIRIADIGCGAGTLLQQLEFLGFSDLTGIDPNISREVTRGRGFRILKTQLADVQDLFDILMFHHSLEHIPDQLGIMQSAFERLVPGGYCLVRIPLVSSEAWRLYGLDWVQLDAPRHLYLHSEKSMISLARRCGFELINVEYDSDDFQFWGSEALKRGLPLVDPGTGRQNEGALALAREGRTRWRRAAQDLNFRSQGDQASFLLRKPGPNADRH